MNREPLNKLVTIGQLKVEAYDEREFRGLVTGARARLSDARDDKLSPPSQFDLAYNAAHGLALAAMRYRGYRPARRFTVFQALEHTLGFAAADWRVLDKCHAMRNRMAESPSNRSPAHGHCW